jgi:N-acetyltransferase
VTGDFIDAGVLEAGPVRLEPLDVHHVDDLWKAAEGDRSSFGLTDVPHGREETWEYVRRAVDARLARQAVPGVAVGTSRFCHMEFWRWPDTDRPRAADRPDAAQIGYTWLAAHTQGTGVNRWAKRVMLELAFETWRLSRVTLRTDARNARSRRAILGLGATLEGVLRAAQVGYDGRIRDSASYSILDSEWPRVRDELDRRLRH